MRSIIGPRWVTWKLAFLRIAQKTFHRRLYNALGVWIIFCKLEVCKMHGGCSFRVSGKSRCSMFVAYSTCFGLVRCVEKFILNGAQENWIFQELRRKPQIVDLKCFWCSQHFWMFSLVRCGANFFYLGRRKTLFLKSSAEVLKRSAL